MHISTKSQFICSVCNPGLDITGALYNDFIKILNLDAVYLPTQTQSAKEGLAAINVLGFRGVSASMPFKQDIMDVVDEVDPIAKTIGAVNTAVNHNGYWKGFNTDWYGFSAALKEVTDLNQKKVLMIGAGGAARAIAYAITSDGGKLYVSNRTRSKGEALALDFNGAFIAADDVSAAHNFDVIVNATSMGFMGDTQLCIPEELICPNQVIFDAVFTPIETPLLKAALAKGATVVEGHKMFIYQAIMQLEIWLGAQVSKEQFNALEEAVKAYIEGGGT